jgi:hypothetical protein
MMDNKTTISFNSQNNDMMTGEAQARLCPSLIPLFSSVRLLRLSSNKSSSVPSVFKKVRLSRQFLLTLLWVD